MNVTLKHCMFYTLQYNRSWLPVLQNYFGYTNMENVARNLL